VPVVNEGPAGQPPRGWPELLAELVSGMAHTLNNRAATLRALHAVLTTDGASRAHDLLEAEIGRVESATALLHLAGGRPRTHREAIVPADLLREAAALYAMHDQLRDVPLEVDPAPTSAVLAASTPLLHALLLLLDAAARCAAASGGGVRAVARNAGPEVELVVACAAGDAADADAALRAAAPLAEAAGAEVRADRAEGELRLVLAAPTLAAARAREAGGAAG
jgi:hypothetical protein